MRHAPATRIDFNESEAIVAVGGKGGLKVGVRVRFRLKLGSMQVLGAFAAALNFSAPTA